MPIPYHPRPPRTPKAPGKVYSDVPTEQVRRTIQEIGMAEMRQEAVISPDAPAEPMAIEPQLDVTQAPESYEPPSKTE